MLLAKRFTHGARKKDVSEVATVAFSMTLEQAIDLATNLLKTMQCEQRWFGPGHDAGWAENSTRTVPMQYRALSLVRYKRSARLPSRTRWDWN
jgi:hypothetical protein